MNTQGLFSRREREGTRGLKTVGRGRAAVGAFLWQRARVSAPAQGAVGESTFFKLTDPIVRSRHAFVTL